VVEQAATAANQKAEKAKTKALDGLAQ